MSDDLPEVEIEAEEAEDLYRTFHGIAIPEAVYDALFDEFEAWNDLSRWPEEQERHRLDSYTHLLDTLARMLAHDTGADSGLETLTDEAVNRTIRAVLQDVCRRVKAKGDA